MKIREWDITEFIKMLNKKASEKVYSWQAAPDADFMAWLAAKSDEWHQQMYAVLYKEVSTDNNLYKLDDVQIVRLSDRRYRPGKKCYFPSEDVDHDELLPRVARGVYTSGTRKAQQEEARKLLEKIGVREVREAEEVERILKQHYTKDAKWPSDTTHKAHLRRFIALVESDSSKSTVFSSYFIFKIEGGHHAQPGDVYLDVPFKETHLRAFYRILPENKPHKFPLSATYVDLGLSAEEVGKFAEQLGAQCYLKTRKSPIGDSHPESEHLFSGDVRKPNNDYYGRIEENYENTGINALLDHQSLNCAKLIWLTMRRHVGKEMLYAEWRRNNQSEPKKGRSSLVHALRNAAWVPQTDGQFVKPAQASSSRLPPGFPFDPGWEWIKAIGFGEDEKKQSEEFQRRQTSAKDLGFQSEAQLERARRFAELPEAEQERFLAEAEKHRGIELPENVPKNPEKRAEGVAAQARKAPHKTSEQRARAISVGLTEIKGEADKYLNHQYTNREGQMICQICQTELPFKLENSNYYFERVEFLEELADRHYQNYLALCPNHSTMFRYANGSRELILEKFREMIGNQLDVVLAHSDMRIYFTSTHRDDLKAVLGADQAKGRVKGQEDELP